MVCYRVSKRLLNARTEITKLGNGYSDVISGASVTNNSSFKTADFAVLNLKLSGVTLIETEDTTVLMKLPEGFYNPNTEVYIVAFAYKNLICASAWIRNNGELCIENVSLNNQQLTIVAAFATK